MLDPRMLEFFKSFLVSQSKDRQQIPKAYRKHIEGRGPRTIHLSGPSGDTWRVSLSQDKNKPDLLYFKDGWPLFVKDHQLEDGEFLFFLCLGESKYKVEIFDLSGCPKEAAFSAKSSQGKAAPKSGHKWFEAGEPSSARTAELRMIINDSHYAHMNIPKNRFVELKDIVNKRSATLRDMSGKLWPAKITFQFGPSPQFTISDGWHEFFTGNKLEIGDICIFELLLRGEESTTLLMDVRELKI